jgi:ABC-type nickel/cobalt efflux system permease component RcnA
VLKSPIQPSAETRSDGPSSRRWDELDNAPTLFADEPVAADRSVGSSGRRFSEEEKSAYSRSSAEVNWTNLIDTEELRPAFVLLAVGLSILFGASHALSPGHGKTIVAAYLVGSRGTVKHAIFLGLVVTLTHVSGVFILGVVTLYFSQYIVPDRLYPIIESASGLLIIAVGMAIFLKRYGAYQKLKFAESLAIEVDDHDHHHQDHHHHPHSHKHLHDHLYGDSHSHGHGHGTHTHEIPADVSFKDLLLLGITGGIVPCPSAIVVLVAAIALHRIFFGLTLIVFFSFGLAAVLIGIGILMVTAKWVFDRFRQHGKAIRWLQIASPVLVILLGFAILIRGLQSAGLIRYYQ